MLRKMMVFFISEPDDLVGVTIYQANWLQAQKDENEIPPKVPASQY